MSDVGTRTIKGHIGELVTLSKSVIPHLFQEAYKAIYNQYLIIVLPQEAIMAIYIILFLTAL